MKAVDYNLLATDYEVHRRTNPDVLARLMGVLRSNSRVLELGCGTGNYTAEITDGTSCECSAVEPSDEMIAKARARLPSISIRRERAEQLSFPDHTFDLVFSVDVVHHLADRPLAFREAFRVLRPGGALCTVTDSEWVIRHREPLAEYFPETVDVELARYPAIETLRDEKRDAGFDHIRDELAEHSYDLTSAAAYQARVFSSLLYIDKEAHERGVARLEARLREGPLRCTSRYSMLWGTKLA